MRLRRELGRIVIDTREVHERVHVFQGGMRLGGLTGLNAPLIALSLFDTYLQMEPRFKFLKFTAPTWEARYNEIVELQAVGFGGLNSGIRIMTERGDWAVFKTRQRISVLSALSALQLPVISQPIGFDWTNPGRKPAS
jgi:hypothetical protein